MNVQRVAIDATTYESHALHRTARTWTETNCYIDLWVELLHALGLDPVAAASVTLCSDFEGDQWTMFKFPPGDLWTLFGIQVTELNVWRPLVDHVIEQLSFGRLLTVDVDAWFLPDTQGITYQIAHQKTTLTPQTVDRGRRTMGYFHNSGYFVLEGDDFDGVFRLGEHEDPPHVLAPYVEVIKLENLHSSPDPPIGVVKQLIRTHLSQRPTSNPFERFAERLHSDLGWLAEQDMETFHRYAFGTCRQCGANAELAATFIEWLDLRDDGGLANVAALFRTISDNAKALQFNLARAARGRYVDIEIPLAEMAAAWDTAMEQLVERYG